MLTFVAHPDDDLLFINPDIADAVRAGRPVTTVYLTAGEIGGAGSTAGQRARSRQRGIQDAYAFMAGRVPAGDQREWTGELIDVAGRQVECYSLTGEDVRLVWLGTPDGQLADLVNNGVPKSTVVPTGGLGARVYTYRRSDLAAAVGALIRLYAPAGELADVHAMDPLPESRYSPLDHADHTAAAVLVAEVSPVPLAAHRGYSIGSLPQNLASPVAADKLATFNVYAAYDPNAAANGWTERMVYRWPRGVSWIGVNADDSLQVFVVRVGIVWSWWQENGGWAGPVTYDYGGPVAPTLAVGQDADGRMELLARRLTDHRILTMWQTAPSGGWAGPADLGSPNAGLSNVGQVGCPAAASNADGRLQMFVKNGGGGVSSKAQTSPNNGWGTWTDLGGTDVQDVACATGPSGRIEVFAATRAGVLHWYQATPNGAYTPNTAMPAVPPSSPITVVTGADGRMHQIYRTGGAQVAIVSQTAPDSGWRQPVLSTGPGGIGQVAAVLDGGMVRLYARNATGGVSTALVDASSAVGAWASLGGTVDVPAVALGPDGLPVLATATDGVVSVLDGGNWHDLA